MNRIKIKECVPFSFNDLYENIRGKLLLKENSDKFREIFKSGKNVGYIFYPQEHNHNWVVIYCLPNILPLIQRGRKFRYRYTTPINWLPLPKFPINITVDTYAWGEFWLLHNRVVSMLDILSTEIICPNCREKIQLGHLLNVYSIYDINMCKQCAPSYY